MPEFTDQNCVELLRLLHKYVTEYAPDLTKDMKISELVEDLAMSMDVTTDEADSLRKEIEAVLV